MKSVVSIRLSDFFSSVPDFCFHSLVSGSVSLEKVQIGLTDESHTEAWEHKESRQ